MLYFISPQNQEKMIWKKSGLKKMEKTGFPTINLAVREDGFDLFGPDREAEHVHYQYTSLEDIVELERLLLLKTSDGSYQFVAKRVFTEEEKQEFLPRSTEEQRRGLLQAPAVMRQKGISGKRATWSETRILREWERLVRWRTSSRAQARRKRQMAEQVMMRTVRNRRKRRQKSFSPPEICESSLKIQLILAAAADSAQQGKRGGDRLENTQCPGAGCQGDDGNI